MKISKKVLVIFIFISFLIGGFCLAQRKLETAYPTIPEVETPTTVKTALPDYLRYVFTFAIIISGLIAFGAIIYGGMLYLTSTGDPTKISEGKDQAIAGILGLIIVLSSFLILNTINPQLVLPEGATQPGETGIKIYANSIDCGKNPIEGSQDITEFLVRGSYPKLHETKDSRVVLDWGAEGTYEISSIEFLSKPESLTIEFYSEDDYEAPLIRYDETNYHQNDCQLYDRDQPKSVKLDYHNPGVYLYSNSLDCGKNPIPGKQREDIEVKIYQSSSATLPEFDNETMSIKFIYGDKDPDKDEYGVQFAAILHEDENFMGQAMLFDQGQGEDNCQDLSVNSYGGPADIGVSSITIYLKPIGAPIGEGVRFWGDKSYTMEKDKFILPEQNPETEKKYYGKNHSEWNEGYYAPDVEEEMEGSNDKITSMEIKGRYIALLFEDEDFKNDCEVFTESKPDFRPFRIGQCGILGRSDCLSSFIVKATK